jgi:predicted NAD/FAD-binding protein
MLAMLNRQSQQNNSANVLQQFQQFKQQMAGKDPKAMIEELLRTGKMTQQQFDQLSQQAKQLAQFLK